MTTKKEEKPLTIQEQADLAAEELCKEDHPGNVYSDWAEMYKAVKEAREGGDAETQFVFRPGGPAIIPPGEYDCHNVTLDGSAAKGSKNVEVMFEDGAFIDNLHAINDLDFVALGAPPLRYDNNFQGAPKAPTKRKRSHPVDGKKRGKRRRDFGAAGKGFNAKGQR